MRRFIETFVLPCTRDAFWDAFFDEAYVRALYLDALGFKAVEILERKGDSRKIRVVPKLNLPDVLAKLVGDAFAYEEHGALDRAKSEWTWKMVQTGRLDVVATSGVVLVGDAGDGTCRRHDELTIEGKVFGLGRLIESVAEKEARAAWAKEGPFLSRWMASHGKA